MSSFDKLPLDIKFILLNSITDIDTLMSLVLTCRGYNQVFRQYKGTILKSTWKRELSTYAKESYFIATFYNRLHHGRASDAAVYGIIKQYIRFDGTYREAEPGLTDEQIIEHHKSLRRLCATFVANEMYPKLDIPVSVRRTDGNQGLVTVTISEKQRIIRALYRFWICVLLFGGRRQKADPSNGAMLYTWDRLPDFVAAELFDSWGLWDFMAVKTIKDFFWDQLLPLARLTYNDKWTSDFRLYIGLYESELSYHAVTQFSRLMIHSFPHEIQSWFKPKKTPNNQLKRYEALCRKLLDFVHTINGDHQDENEVFSQLFTVYSDGVLWNRRYLEEKPWPDTPAMRICKPGGECFPLDQKTGVKSWTRLYKWRDLNSIDLKACIWDDRRLEGWGYVFPKFVAQMEVDDIIYLDGRPWYEHPAVGSLSTVLDNHFGHPELDCDPMCCEEWYKLQQ